jgi:predicted secreted protein
MAAAGKFDGKDLLVYVGGVAITHSESCTLNINQAMISATTKDSGNWEDVLPGNRDWSVDCSGMVALDATYGAVNLTTLITGATSVVLNFRLKSSASTDKYWTGSAYLTSLSLEAARGSTASFTASFKGDGALTNPSKT